MVRNRALAPEVKLHLGAYRTCGGRPVRSYFSIFLDHIEQCDDVTHEQLPERWVDLINYLNAQEQEQRLAATSPHDRRRPTTH
jgi:hypothetical protein